MDHYQAAANVAIFLLGETDDIRGKWVGGMKASQQRELFGKYLGKGTLVIDGAKCTIEHWAKASFGTDSDITAEFNLNTGVAHKNGRFI